MALHGQIVVNENPDPLVVCDDNSNGFALFDLHQADADITMGDSSLIVTYHVSISDAQNAINVLLSPYMNQVPYADMVYARVEDGEHDDAAFVPLDLLVQELPQINQPIDLVAIDEDDDGIAVFNLTENDAVMLGDLDPLNYEISYHISLAEAIAGEYPIAEPSSFYNTENPQIIYARVQNIDRGCFVTTSFTISVETLSVDSIRFQDLSIYPNPTSASFTVQSSQLDSESIISVYDIQGKMLISKIALPKNGKIEMDISSLKSAVYFVVLSSEENYSIRKIIRN